MSQLFLKKGLYLTSFEMILNGYYFEEKGRVMAACYSINYARDGCLMRGGQLVCAPSSVLGSIIPMSRGPKDPDEDNRLPCGRSVLHYFNALDQIILLK